MNIDKLSKQSKYLRKKIFESVYHGNGGHIGGSFSVIDILNYLYTEIVKFDPLNPKQKDRDRVILSKGHSCLALYWVLSMNGFFKEELIHSYGTNGSVFAGHPEYNKAAGIEISSGSLGHGPSIGVGIAHALKLQKIPARVFVIVGDGESNEGAVWEAAMCASQLKLDNFFMIIDNNGMESLDMTKNIMNIEPVDQKLMSFGFDIGRINGHNFLEMGSAFKRLLELKNKKPKAIIADTIKAYGLSFTQGISKWHYRAPNSDEFKSGMEELSE